MGNSASTLQTHADEIEEEMKQRIALSAGNKFAAQLSQPNVSHLVAKATNGGTSFSSIEASSNGMIDLLMAAVAWTLFALDFQYFFSDDPDMCKPPGALGDTKTVSSICSISTPVGNQVPEYLNSGLFKKLGLPMWVEQQASADLVEIASKLVTDSADPMWGSVDMTRTYDSAVGDQGDWRVDAVLLYVNGALTFDGLRAGFSIIYYLGVFYRVQSDSKSIRDGIRRDAFTAAARLAGGSTPGTDAQLSDTLKTSATTTFRDKFGFAFGSTPPESWRAEGAASAYLKWNTELTYLPMVNPGYDYLSTSIEQGLFSGLDVPISSIEQEALTDITTNFVKILSGNSQASWRTDNLDLFYMPADPTLNPIRQKTILMSWYQYKINSNSLKIPVSYVYVQTAFYEELPVERRAVKRLFQILADKIRQELQKPSPPGDDLLSLKAMVEEYAGIQFISNFGFPFNGSQSNPPDRRPGGAVRGYQELMQTTNFPTSVAEVESWLNAEVFLKDSLTFPAFANNRIWEKIRDEVVEFTKRTTSDNWYTAYSSTVYRHPTGGTNIKQYSQYVYALGELELDGVKVKRVYVCYLGVYCGTLKTA